LYFFNTMKFSSSLFLLSTAIVGIKTVLAFPNGAGGCESGGAVGGAHLTNPTTGSLETGGFQVVTNQNIKLVPNLEVTAISPLQTYLLNVIPNVGSTATFKGALIRVNGTGTYAIIPGDNSKEADKCTNLGVGGVTHTDSTAKTFFGSSFSTESLGDYVVEVTVVVQNNSSGSIYYYDKYVLTSFDETPIFPTITPVRGNETKAPTGPVSATVPVPAPVAGPVAVPVAVPVATNSTPVETPSASIVPSDVPSDMLSDAPSFTPTNGETAPVVAPTGAPVVANKTSAPVAKPVAAPIRPAPVPVNPLPAPTSAALATTQWVSILLIGSSTIAAIVVSTMY
jgi:hypothetical protein